MRLLQNSQNGSHGWSKLSVFASIGLMMVASLSGCKNGFIDPGEMGRYETKPLPIAILNHLDTGGLEIDPRFRNATDVRAEDLAPTQGDYGLSRNDLVSVSITDLVAPGVESVKTMRISESGKISMPLVGQIQAAGLTESQLETAVQQAYRDANLIQNATVSVIVLEARGRTFTAYGAVNQVGEYQILGGDFRLLQAITYAHGMTTPTGIDYIYIIRRFNETGPAAAPGAGPSTRPNTDVLVPRSDANHRVGRDQIAMGAHRLSLSTQGQPAEPAAQPAEPASQPGETEGRMITIEGRAVPTEPPSNTDAADRTMAQPPTSDAQPAPVTDPNFQFNAPQMPNDVRIIRVPWRLLADNGDLRYNVVIRPGDIVWAPNPSIGVYYMGGHVQRVGVYSLTAQKITLKQATIAAGMLDQVAIPQRTQIVRRLEGQDQEVFTMVDLAKIFAGEAPDVYLKPEDQVMVGTNFVAPFIAALRNGFRITYGFGFLYDRNYFNPQSNNGN